MFLKILGSGTIKTPHLKNCSGYLVNNEFLLDCGPGIWRALGQNNVMNERIKYIALSHFHPDHVSDLAPFLLERYLLKRNAKAKLILIGPRDLKEWFTNFAKLFGEWIQNIPIETVEIESDAKIAKYIIKTLPTGHTSNSICYRIEDSDNKVIFYSGDSGENENLHILSQNVDLAIFEASNTPKTKIEGHLTPQLAAQIANRSDVKRLVLTHIYPDVYDSDDITEATKIFRNELIIADDNMNLEIK